MGLITDGYPLFTVIRLEQSRDFFMGHFGMRVVFQARWVVMLSHRDDGGISLGLMTADHPSRPPGPETFNGQGAILTLQVDDATALYDTVEAQGAEIWYSLTDEPWGQRRFMLRDPSGILVDVVEQIAPAPGFWEKS
jgi:catechol 2,3-dioxygenase-like lactoylglutathione lyase family enzyme